MDIYYNDLSYNESILKTELIDINIEIVNRELKFLFSLFSMLDECTEYEKERVYDRIKKLQMLNHMLEEQKQQIYNNMFKEV